MPLVDNKIETLNNRFDALIEQIKGDLEEAKTAFQGGKVDLAKLYVDSAGVKSTFAIADRIDVFLKLFIKKSGDE
jgi:hypothetical protein